MKCPIILWLMLTAHTAFAQQPTGLLQQDQHLLPEASAILTEQIQAYKTAKVTATNPRVVAYTETYAGSSTDSIVYVYSGGRGCGKVLMAYLPVIGFSEGGDAFVNADSIARYSTPPSMPTVPPTFRYRDYCTYDAANRILTHTQHSSTTTTYRLYYTYDAAGNVTRRLTRSTPVGLNNYTDYLDAHFRYNANNKVILDSVYTPGVGPNWRRFSYYDASNRLASSARYDWVVASATWRRSDSMIYTYYPNNLLKTALRYSYGASAVNGTRDSFGYTGNNPLNTYSLSSLSTAGGPWVIDLQATNTLTPAGDNYLVRMVSGYNGTSYFPYEKVVGYYNADSTVRRGEYYHYTGSTQQTIPYMSLNYYYEQSSTPPPPAIVASLNPAEALHIYPNPAGTYITIDLPAAQSSWSVELVDAAGRSVGSASCAASPMRIDVGHLPAGWYGVRLRSAQGYLRGGGQFVKR